MDVLHTLHQNPHVNYAELLGERAAKAGNAGQGTNAESDRDDMDDFLAEFELGAARTSAKTRFTGWLRSCRSSFTKNDGNRCVLPRSKRATSVSTPRITC
ncbi:hypothetical protein D1872_308600 [compost metagenome]